MPNTALPAIAGSCRGQCLGADGVFSWCCRCSGCSALSISAGCWRPRVAPTVVKALQLSIIAPVVLILALVFASWVALRGKRRLDLAVLLAPAVAGLALPLTSGRDRLLGPSLDSLGIELRFCAGALREFGATIILAPEGRLAPGVTLRCMPERDFALVLSGGGVTGVAWETGLLKGLRDRGIDLTGADLLVGTSAGSIVGTQIAAGLDLNALYARQLQPPDPQIEIAPAVNVAQEMTKHAPELASLFAGQSPDEPGLPQAVLVAFGRFAVEAKTPPEADRLAIIGHRLQVTEWPERRLVLTAVDVEDGHFATWDRDSGVELTRAVASSCAVPFVWPPVTIDGRRYMDGGIRSPSNADLAIGYSRVVVIAPMGTATPMGSTLLKEKRILEERGAIVQIVEADAASLEAFGPDLLDPSRRVAAAEAGWRQAPVAAEALAAVAN